MMDRRDFLTITAGMLVAPLAATAYAQGPSPPLLAILDSGSPVGQGPWMLAFKQALAELGWVDGRSVRFETRHAENRLDRMAAAAKEVVTLKPDLIFTHGTSTMIRAVVQAAGTIPIVVGATGDPVAAGFAKSLARPGGNVTGMSLLYGELEQKRLEILKDAVPGIRRVGVLVNAVTASRYDEGLLEATRPLDIQLEFQRVATPDEIRRAVTALKRRSADALLVQDEPLLARSVRDIAALALTLRLPSISQSSRFAESGGLLQFGADILDVFRRSAGHVDKILRGAKPGDVPIEQPTKFALIVNLKTAKALGLTIPPSLLARADQVID
jgi:putative tryptophan/tyrosine transport system substrate-binding protein